MLSEKESEPMQGEPKTKYESVPVPFQVDIYGRRYLTHVQVTQDPELGRFMSRFPNHFTYDRNLDVYWFKDEDKS